jgi:AcrR family transcriptional regulator
VRPAYDHTGDSAPVKPRPLRADARRNRERILAAATAAFAADGLSVPLDEIARQAGVGPGTLYRHFPAKEALWEAVLLDRLERLADEAEALHRATDPSAAGSSTSGPNASGSSTSGPNASGSSTSGPSASGPDTSGPGTSGPGAADPGEVLLGFIDRLVAEAAPKRDLADALASAGADVSTTLASTAGRLRAAIGALLAAAQRGGSIRSDIGLAELMAILSGILFALRGRPGDQPDPRRVAAVLRDGLLSPAEQGTGHAGVRDQALDQPAADRRADRGALGDPVSDRDDGRDLGQR